MKVTGPLFSDTVNGRMVNEYTDKYNDKFMAQSRFGTRVKIKQ